MYKKNFKNTLKNFSKIIASSFLLSSGVSFADWKTDFANNSQINLTENDPKEKSYSYIPDSSLSESSIEIANISPIITIKDKTKQETEIILADSSPSLSDFSPIITVKEEPKEEKAPPSPGLSFGVPSAYGASGGSVFVGLSYSADGQDGPFKIYKDGDKLADGSMNFGMGFGDPNQLGAEVSVGIISLLCQSGSSCFGADGTIGLKLHKLFDESFIDGFGVGYSNLVRWGEASDIDTIYGVASKDFKINNKDGLLSLGVGTGGFRSKTDIDSGENNPNLFGGIGLKLAPRISLASSWNGSTLAAGFGLSPFDVPLSLSIGLTDLTDVNGKGSQYSINAGYSFSF